MTPFEKAYNDVSALVRLFEEHKDQYLDPKYKEAELRTAFLDKFWVALGWDVRHDVQTNPREQEVKIELSDGASYLKPDYAFFLKPNFERPAFLVEAKKPFGTLETQDNYFQTARYGFNHATTVAILTDFQEFHLIDCRRKPEFVPGIIACRIKDGKFRYTDFLDRNKFGSFYWLFSREAVAEGKLKDYWKSLAKPRSAEKQLKLIGDQLQQPDDLFLDDLDRFRQILASAFKSANKSLTNEDLTAAAQKVLDRIVFIRFLQDKEIEPDNIIEKFTSNVKGSSWKSFIAQSKKLDKFYNGVVFKRHFIDEPDFCAPNDDRFATVADAFSPHYSGPNRSPYLFSIIPVEILGSIYERFLGKVVVSKDGRVAIEKKPEVRKAGGVYYTPKYIVDYIVENSVGKLLEGKTPNEVSNLRCADIACGSGSFLIAIFDRIMRHLEEWYTQNPNAALKAGCREVVSDNGQILYSLSLEQKRAILQKNIFGVDIDPQAVEVAQFSLFLKLLESETISTVKGFASMELELRGEALERRKQNKNLISRGQLTFHHGIDRKILPDLSKNIQCGNSLVEYDISDLIPLTDEEEKRIKPFSFNTEFRLIMANGGFDAIVGNPPYVRNRQLDEVQKKYFGATYSTAAGQYDIYQLFFERAIGILKPHGDLGYITSNKYAIASYGLKLREFILESSEIRVLLDVSNIDVFKQVSTYPYIIILERDGAHRDVLIKFAKASSEAFFEGPQYETIAQALFEQSVTKNFVLKHENPVLSSIERNSTPLGELVTIKETIHTGNVRDKLVTNERRDRNSKRLLAGKDCHRYYYKWNGKYLQYDPKLINRSKGEYANLCDPKYFENPKILLREIALRIECCFDTDDYYVLNKAYSVQLRPGAKYDYLFLLGVLNSKLLTYYFQERFEESHVSGGYLQFKKIYSSQLPIVKLDLTHLFEKKQHDQLVRSVDQMLDTKKRLTSATNDTDRERHQKKCEYLDGEIDKLVYALYGLTAAEIRIVEGS